MSAIENTKITIGIPVYNEEKNIGFLLKSIRSWAINCEIIVVSSGSTDSTNIIVQEHLGVKLITEDCRKGKVSAIKKIIHHAKGDIVVLTDGDVLVGKNSICNLVGCFDDAKVLACTGRVEPINGKSKMMNELARIACLVWDKLRSDNDKASEFLYPTGYLHAIRRTTLNRIDIKNSVINDDAEIGMNLYAEGIKYRYCRDAIVKVKFPDNVSDYFKQKIRTRLGRRQSAVSIISKNQEKELSRILASIIFRSTYSNAFYGLVLYIFDAAARVAATYAGHRISNDAHIWKEVKSTK